MSIALRAQFRIAIGEQALQSLTLPLDLPDLLVPGCQTVLKVRSLVRGHRPRVVEFALEQCSAVGCVGERGRGQTELLGQRLGRGFEIEQSRLKRRADGGVARRRPAAREGAGYGVGEVGLL